MTPANNTPAALAMLAKSNPGIFNAMFARAPKAVTYNGKSYVRDSAASVEAKLWYLAAVARSQPTALRAIQGGSYSLDEVFGLDPDRSEIDAATAELRTAELARDKAQARVKSLKAQVADFENRVKDAQKRKEECGKRPVDATDVLLAVGTLGAGNLARTAGCEAYEGGQVQLWKDRIQAVKTGAMVGMAGQEGFAVPVNDGIVQNEAKVREANAEVTAAKSRLNAAKRAFDAAARAQRMEEAKAAREEAMARAQDAAEAARLEAELRAQEQAAAQLANSYAVTEQETGWYGSATDPSAHVWEEDTFSDDGGYYEEEGGYTDEENDNWYWEEFDAGMRMFGLDERAHQYAADQTGWSPSNDANASLSYVSPWQFDTYYADAPCDCDGCGDECGGGVDTLRAQMLGSGWGFDASVSFEADKITEEGEQGFGGLSIPPMPQLTTGTSAAPFDFASIIPLIITGILMIAPLVISAFAPPPAVHEAGPVPDSVIKDVVAATPPPMVQADTSLLNERNVLIGAGLFLIYKLVS